tara:strand:- start:35 stop:241 length:207 start_codon:yes stop_codon:yes gene_type:complete
MRRTRIMLAMVITLIITFITLGVFHFLLSTGSFKESLLSNPVIGVMIFIGWVPAAIVGIDMSEWEDDY